MLNRRHFIAGAATASLARPALVRAAPASTLRFVPMIDLAFPDPIYATAQVSRTHGFMVFDTLYGMNSWLECRRRWSKATRSRTTASSGI